MKHAIFYLLLQFSSLLHGSPSPSDLKDLTPWSCTMLNFPNLPWQNGRLCFLSHPGRQFSCILTALGIRLCIHQVLFLSVLQPHRDMWKPKAEQKSSWRREQDICLYDERSSNTEVSRAYALLNLQPHTAAPSGGCTSLQLFKLHVMTSGMATMRSGETRRCLEVCGKFGRCLSLVLSLITLPSFLGTSDFLESPAQEGLHWATMAQVTAGLGPIVAEGWDTGHRERVTCIYSCPFPLLPSSIPWEHVTLFTRLLPFCDI